MLSPYEVNRAFGVRLRTARDQAQFSQSQLAARSEIGRTTIANMELGAQAATVFQIVRLAQAMGLEPRDLLPDLSQVATDDADVARMIRHREAILGL
jgi:transcriptional regulator with XRE-family HTH domain